jgi:hypothetical protein
MISTVIQRSGGAFVYNENGKHTATITCFTGSDTLVGYTSVTVSIKRNPVSGNRGVVYTYDENGHQLRSNPC